MGPSPTLPHHPTPRLRALEVEKKSKDKRKRAGVWKMMFLDGATFFLTTFSTAVRTCIMVMRVDVESGWLRVKMFQRDSKVSGSHSTFPFVFRGPPSDSVLSPCPTLPRLALPVWFQEKCQGAEVGMGQAANRVLFPRPPPPSSSSSSFNGGGLINVNFVIERVRPRCGILSWLLSDREDWRRMWYRGQSGMIILISLNVVLNF